MRDDVINIIMIETTTAIKVDLTVFAFMILLIII
jgi:hypothetical protein